MVFANQSLKVFFTFVGFSDDFCLVFTLRDFDGRMTKIEDRYWIETTFFVHSSDSTKSEATSGIKATAPPYVHAPHTQNPNSRILSRFKVLPNAQTFCDKPDPSFSTNYSDLFVTYTHGFNMHAGQPNPQSRINEYISGKIVLDIYNIRCNNFATIDFDEHINTKIDYTINHVFARIQYKT